MRARDVGLAIGRLPPGQHNAITDVAGVRVGHTTLIEGEGELRRGIGPVRTGVTIVVPHGGDVWTEAIYAGCHTLNGNGEVTGLEWIRESGLLGGAIGLTNTHSVGVVRDALVSAACSANEGEQVFWALPVVGETYDGALNDCNGQHVRTGHALTALQAARAGPVQEGNVGGGTGMICHEFKGGIGTASRIVSASGHEWTVGVLVQANFGRRDLLRIDGVPVGAAIDRHEVPSAWDQVEMLDRQRGSAHEPGGSIIVLVATDAPLLPHQCTRLAQRPTLALGRVGSIGAHGSGDLFLAWTTGNGGIANRAQPSGTPGVVDVRSVQGEMIDGLFEATIEATEEAVLNAMLAAETMIGRDGITAHRLPHERLVEVMERYGRSPSRLS